MTDQDRVVILGMMRAILKENAPVIITHGTDTMVETGVYLQRGLPALRLPIVLTGPMTPLGSEGSDGLQNLTESLLAVQLLQAGVYVVMHGAVKSGWVSIPPLSPKTIPKSLDAPFLTSDKVQL